MARTLAAVAGLAKEDSAPAPRFLPLLLLLSALLWVFTMTGGQQVFVKEVLGGAYDSQAEHWEFAPGDRVQCEIVVSSDGPIRAAVRLAD